MFCVLLTALARQVPEIAVMRVAGELALYAVVAGTAMVAVVAGLTRLEATPFVVAAAALPLGTAAYAAALLFGGDRTARTLFGLVRAYVGRRPWVSSARSSKAPPAPKTD